MPSVDAIVIGAGAVGLAIGAELARRGHETYVLEHASGIGTGTSSRNSEVIHAGLYYPTGSLKQRLCVEGKARLYAYLEARHIPHRRTGKLIVATNENESAKLDALHQRGAANGVMDLERLTARQAKALEPNLTCTEAILSPSTGILDSHSFMLALQGDIEDHGGAVVLNAPFEHASPLPDGRFAVRVGGSDPLDVTAKIVVNSAGLHAHETALKFDGTTRDDLPDFTLAKGSYFSCSAKSPFRHLIYPTPVDGGLGVHVTLDLGGALRFGPDVEWLGHADPGRVDYTVDPARCAGFYSAIRTYWEGLPDGSILPAYSGCRPKLSRPGQPAADFCIRGPGHHGHAGLVHLFGIESPGLTSSLAIAAHVADLLQVSP